MTNEPIHQPTPEFRDRLEHDVLRAYRADQRFAEPVRRRSSGWARAAALVIASAAIGATAGLAPAQIRDSARRDSLLQAAQADASLAALRLQIARQEEAETKREVDAGKLDARVLADADAKVREVEMQVMRARYDIDEITATAQPPRDDLNAPLVHGRDFVTDRIQLELRSAQERLSAAEAAAADAERRAQLGAATELAAVDARVGLAGAKRDFAVLAQRLSLRKEYLEKGTSIDELTRRLDRFEVTEALAVAQQSLAVQQQRLAEIQKQHASGAADDLALLRAQLDAKMVEVEARNLMLRLRQMPRAKSE